MARQGKRTTHSDLVERKEVTIEYCPTDEMMADFFTKSLVGLFWKRQEIDHE